MLYIDRYLCYIDKYRPSDHFCINDRECPLQGRWFKQHLSQFSSNRIFTSAGADVSLPPYSRYTKHIPDSTIKCEKFTFFLQCHALVMTFVHVARKPCFQCQELTLCLWETINILTLTADLRNVLTLKAASKQKTYSCAHLFGKTETVMTRTRTIC